MVANNSPTWRKYVSGSCPDTSSFGTPAPSRKAASRRPGSACPTGGGGGVAAAGRCDRAPGDRPSGPPRPASGATATGGVGSAWTGQARRRFVAQQVVPVVHARRHDRHFGGRKACAAASTLSGCDGPCHDTAGFAPLNRSSSSPNGSRTFSSRKSNGSRTPGVTALGAGSPNGRAAGGGAPSRSPVSSPNGSSRADIRGSANGSARGAARGGGGGGGAAGAGRGARNSSSPNGSSRSMSGAAPRGSRAALAVTVRLLMLSTSLTRTR